MVIAYEVDQKKRYKDTLKVALKKCDIRPESWKDVAHDIAFWRSQDWPRVFLANPSVTGVQVEYPYSL